MPVKELPNPWYVWPTRLFTDKKGEEPIVFLKRRLASLRNGLEIIRSRRKAKQEWEERHARLVLILPLG